MTKKLVPELKKALNRFKLEGEKDIQISSSKFNDSKNFSHKTKFNSTEIFSPSKF